jgi:coniferyl-aldehyde dehydrogenase
MVEHHTEDMSLVLDIQRAAFLDELPVSIDVRKDRLRRCIRMLVENSARFSEALTADFGQRSESVNLLFDVVAPVRQLKHALKNVDRWSRPERRKLDFPLGLLGGRGSVHYQPKGVVGIIAPWNFPVALTIGAVAGAFAAGNRIMVKSSEFVPSVANVFEELASIYFDRSELAFFSGGPETGQAFSALPFDHLIFTGATDVGKHILRAAAGNLTPVTLELGGKSPTIIGRSADMRQAAERIALGKLLNAGQICLAPDYLLVPRELEASFVDRVMRAAAALYPTVEANPDYTALISERHSGRIGDYLADARAKGAITTIVNPGNETFPSPHGRRVPLHIVRNVNDDMLLMREEVFGPILPVVPYDHIDDAIRYVNARERPLGLYYFGQDTAERDLILNRTISGGVTVNDVLFHAVMEDMPFGGVGASGMGNYHGFDGFKTFSHAKAVYRQPRVDFAKLAGFKPPYNEATAKAIARDLKL